MFRVCFELDTFSQGISPERGRVYIEALTQALMVIDALYLTDYPDTPLLYQSGVRYVSEDSPKVNTEYWWRDVPRVLSKGYADCKALAAWRAAELVIRYQVDAEPYVTYMHQPDGSILYHVQVLTPYGIEDPSEKLGMSKVGSLEPPSCLLWQ